MSNYTAQLATVSTNALGHILGIMETHGAIRLLDHNLFPIVLADYPPGFTAMRDIEETQEYMFAYLSRSETLGYDPEGSHIKILGTDAHSVRAGHEPEYIRVTLTDLSTEEICALADYLVANLQILTQ